MKWVKRIAMVLGVLLVLAVGFVVVFFYVLHPKSRSAPSMTAPNTPEAIARGEYLAQHVLGCALCHSPIDESKPGDEVLAGQLFAGRVFPVKEMGFPGTLNGPNLTPDKTAGIGAWTDGEVARAIREGVDRNGKTLFPMMPYTRFKRLTDEDTLAVIAYLRSVPPIATKVPRSEINFPVSMFIRLAPAPLAGSPPAWPTDTVERGKILLEVMSCIDCHTPMVKGKLVDGREFSGGNRFKGAFGDVHSSNITPDQATGIGAYSDDDLMRVFKEGKGKDGRTLWVMPWRALQGTKDEDLRAVIAALRTLKPIQNVVPAPNVTAK
ncbi:MAG TPA: c-type cytochrome [Kofleriaceae bacterium]|nr:c-type cytochrome [Kofleriaceae bacterium]